MPKRKGGSRRKPFKLKLKKKTIYTIFGVGSFLVGGVFLLSFVQSSGPALSINAGLTEKFGSVAILFPFLFFFAGKK